MGCSNDSFSSGCADFSSKYSTEIKIDLCKFIFFTGFCSLNYFHSYYKEKGEEIYLEEGNFCKNCCTLVLIKITENIYKVSRTKSWWGKKKTCVHGAALLCKCLSVPSVFIHSTKRHCGSKQGTFLLLVTSPQLPFLCTHRALHCVVLPYFPFQVSAAPK